MKTPCCPGCEEPAILVSRPKRFRRGNRTLTLDCDQYQCPTGCPSPDNEGVYTFADVALIKAHEATAAAQWQLRFGEPMPPGSRVAREGSS